jgi:hypothetical protein
VEVVGVDMAAAAGPAIRPTLDEWVAGRGHRRSVAVGLEDHLGIDTDPEPMRISEYCPQNFFLDRPLPNILESAGWE